MAYGDSKDGERSDMDMLRLGVVLIDAVGETTAVGVAANSIPPGGETTLLALTTATAGPDTAAAIDPPASIGTGGIVPIEDGCVVSTDGIGTAADIASIVSVPGTEIGTTGTFDSGETILIALSRGLILAKLLVGVMVGVVPIAVKETNNEGGKTFGTSIPRNFKLINLHAILNSLISILPSESVSAKAL